MPDISTPADVCLILEGTYPYVTGGVSSWTQQLLIAQKELKFHLVSLLAKNADLTVRYPIPENVVSNTHVILQDLPSAKSTRRQALSVMKEIEPYLTRLQSRGGFSDLAELWKVLSRTPEIMGKETLLNSKAAWEMLVRMYGAGLSFSSFLDYFWSWRALLGGLYSVLRAPLPNASVYHSLSTGYAGLYAARAHAESGRPCIVTEHGIYTNERKIEMAMANWLHDTAVEGLRIDTMRRTLKDLWVDTFISYSRTCYEASSEIITLYEGNQQYQLQDGAPTDKLRVIPNGIDYDRYCSIPKYRTYRPPTVALIGRVVAIKDVKTFIRSAGILRTSIPDVCALVIGPTDEEKDYYEECVKLVEHLGLQETVQFTGQVNLDEFLGVLDVVVLTSISEAQPLVILEAGALGLPVVATDVGACAEMINGRKAERPELGPGGAITPLCNPTATAQAMAKLLTDSEWYGRCSVALQERVKTHYNKKTVDRTYRELYEKYRGIPGGNA